MLKKKKVWHYNTLFNITIKLIWAVARGDMWHELPAPSEIVFPLFSVCVTLKYEATKAKKTH